MIDYFYDAYLILNKVYSEKTFIKQAISSTDIQEKYRSATIKTVYGVLDKDVELSYYIKKLSQKNPKLVIRTIIKISLYTIKYLKKAPYAVIDSAVELTKKLGKSAMSGFVNALLRRFVNEGVSMPNDDIEALSIKYSYPEYAVKKLIDDYGIDIATKIMDYESDVSYLAFFDIDGEQYLKNKNVKYAKTPVNNVYEVSSFKMDDGFYNGDYTFQHVCSAGICDLIEGGDTLIDVCSAPGGKSVNLSHKFKKVVSLELHQHRVELINSYASRMKRDNITAVAHDSTTIIDEYKEKFDVCLCDVPCSGFGVVIDNPDIKLNREESSIAELNKTQLAILNASSNYVKKGGFLYYSTCSVFQQENQGIIDEFLSKNDDFIQLEIHSNLPNLKVKKGIQFLPHLSGGGFFIAKLQRK